MGFFSMLILIFSLVTLLLFQFCLSATIVVDGVSEWKNPQVQVGDSVIFQHKYHYNLYIFKNQKAFSLCNFTQATLLTRPNSTSYSWHTSRPGSFYFSFNNGSNKACLEGQKLAVEVFLAPPQNAASSPELPPSAAPPPMSGSIVASSPAFPWPFQPHGNTSPSPAPGLSLTASVAAPPDKEGIPFINSNPAVPLPTGEVDSATIRPLPTSGHQHSRQVVGFSGVERVLSSIILLIVIIF
ncbi:hypothetical protein CDL12_04120 [Handroanthus impetiginosus]|uniref:Phytocyanin domain-containing protein n=1 Tax=Handroanthus impetiginosus TaxID=429701 RepID=A0A2G9I077_9LAMI|nr:hypothetical protein CDL12_04120 [Handroanthus impetiginosus]